MLVEFPGFAKLPASLAPWRRQPPAHVVRGSATLGMIRRAAVYAVIATSAREPTGVGPMQYDTPDAAPRAAAVMEKLMPATS